ncbi:hypothetical protein [uncultured Sutterella sp.]|mgnify:FL=1|uniref:hypothetical protein n=1 Tax=uncultured Sutterella sp. TaxID=286133 RepID=UPI00266C4002|nr:hypothetical protein [uncultured Sutterella sp.]
MTAPDEAAIHIHVLPKPCGKASVCVSSTRTNGIARMLASPEHRANARRLITLLYGLCPIAHLTAFDSALLAARGRPSEKRGSAFARLPETAVTAEAIVENLRVLVCESEKLEARTALLGGFAAPQEGRPPLPLTPILGKEEHRQIGALRARLALIAQLLVRLDPHSEEGPDPALFQRLLDALSALLAEARTAASRLLFGMEPEEFLKNLHDRRFDLRGWAESHAGTIPAAHLLLSLLAEPRPPEADVQFLPERSEIMTPDFAEEIAYRLLNDSGFDMAPFWQGAPRLTGALSRMRNNPAVRDLLISEGISPAALTGARIVETACFFARAKALLDLSAGLIDRAMPKEGESAPLSTSEEDGRNVLWTYGPEAGIGISFVETARGLLMHAVKLIPSGELQTLRITSPTEWQFSPNGAGQRMASLAAKAFLYPKDDMDDRAKLENAVERALFGLDACVPTVFAWNGARRSKSESKPCMNSPSPKEFSKSSNAPRAQTM